jgi:hypothetical protein
MYICRLQVDEEKVERIRSESALRDQIVKTAEVMKTLQDERGMLDMIRNDQIEKTAVVKKTLQEVSLLLEGERGQREQKEKVLTDQIEALDSSNAQLTLEYSDRVTGI